uniref:Outer capsid n=1 Tax=Okhotskiy virus TaxID=1471048 RepID=A0A859D184_9REOV|nr:outer capsid [Okhotskiy virus]
MTMEDFEILIKGADKYIPKKQDSYPEFDLVVTPHTADTQGPYDAKAQICSDIEFEEERAKKSEWPASRSAPRAAAAGIGYLEGRLTKDEAEKVVADLDDVSWAPWRPIQGVGYKTRTTCGDLEARARTARTCSFHRLSWCRERRCHTRLEAERVRECVLLCLLLVEHDGKVSFGPRTNEGKRIQCVKPVSSALRLPRVTYSPMGRQDLVKLFVVHPKRPEPCDLSIRTEMAVRSLLLEVFCIIYCFLPAEHRLREGVFHKERKARAAIVPRRVLKNPGGVARRVHNLLAFALQIGDVFTSPRAFYDDPYSWVIATPLFSRAERARDDDDALTMYAALHLLLTCIPGACLEGLEVVQLAARGGEPVEYVLERHQTTRYCDVPIHAWITRTYETPQVGTSASKGMLTRLQNTLAKLRARKLLRVRQRDEIPAVQTYAAAHALMGFVCNGLKEVVSFIIPYRAPRKSYLLVIMGEEHIDDSAILDIEASRADRSQASFLGTCVIRLGKEPRPRISAPVTVRTVVELYSWGATEGVYVALKPRSATRNCDATYSGTFTHCLFVSLFISMPQGPR